MLNPSSFHRNRQEKIAVAESQYCGCPLGKPAHGDLRARPSNRLHSPIFNICKHRTYVDRPTAVPTPNTAKAGPGVVILLRYAAAPAAPAQSPTLATARTFPSSDGRPSLSQSM